MTKVLLRNAGKKTSKNYQRNIAKIARIAIESKAAETSKIEMYSVHELSFKDSLGKPLEDSDGMTKARFN